MFGGSSSQVDRRRGTSTTPPPPTRSTAPAARCSGKRAKHRAIMSRDQGRMWKFLQDGARSPSRRCASCSAHAKSHGRRRTASPIRCIWGFNLLVSSRFPNLWAGCPGWRTAAQPVRSPHQPYRNHKRFSSPTTVKLDRLMEPERERRRRCCRAQSRAVDISLHRFLPKKPTRKTWIRL